MALPLTINGQIFEYPQNFDEDWGVGATGWAQAVTAGALYLSGGNFPLTSQVDFGVSFGIKVKSILTETASPSSSGYIALAHADTIGWRNNANSANLLLAVDASNNLTFNGSALGTTALTNSHIYVGNASNVPTDVAMSGDTTIANTGVVTIANSAITNAKVSATAAIALSKLATVTASRALVSDSGGLVTVSAVTATELGYVSGVTSAIQTQLNTISAASVPSGAMMDFAGVAAPTGWLLCDGSAVSRSTYAALFAAISTTWGTGDGSTTFNLPSMTRRVGMGSGGSGSGTIGNAVGNTGGTETVTLTQAQLPVALGTASSVVTDTGHRHPFKGYGVAGGSTEVTLTQNANTGGVLNTYSGGASGVQLSTTGITVATTITNGSGGNSHNIIQPVAIVLKIIKI